MLLGWASVGGLFTAVTLIVKFFVSLVAKEDAVTEAGKDPEVVDEGARWMFPVRVVPAWALSVLVMNAGPVCVKLIASPSASEAENAWSAVAPAVTVMLLMAASTTGRSTLTTVAVSDFASVPPEPSLTLIEIVAVPESENPGANARFPAAVPVPGEVVVTVA
jgi:hypothetical protein